MRPNGHDKNSNGSGGPCEKPDKPYKPPRKEQDRDRPRGKRVPREIAARAQRAAYDALPARARTTTNLYLDPWTVPKGAMIGPSFEGWVAEREHILTFADFEPQANFAHPCSYFLHDDKTGELLRRVPAQYPPHPLEGLQFLDLFMRAPRVPDEVVVKPEERCKELKSRMAPLMARSTAASTGTAIGKRYAILYSGVTDPHHANDLELCYRTLTDFGFDRIFVLVHNGTKTGTPFQDKQRRLRPWPGSTATPDFQMEVYGKGSRKAFRTVLTQELQPILQPNDLVYIHTDGHGGTRYGSSAGQYLYSIVDGPTSPDRYMDFDMQADLGLIQNYGSLLVVMNQCNSGGFMDSVLAGSLAQRTYFTAACEQNKLAYATADLKWNRFSRNWIAREQVNDADGKVEAREAYVYCDDDTVRGPDTPLDGRSPAPGNNNVSSADGIVLR